MLQSMTHCDHSHALSRNGKVTIIGVLYKLWCQHEALQMLQVLARLQKWHTRFVHAIHLHNQHFGMVRMVES
jgi:hypothetical protein